MRKLFIIVGLLMLIYSINIPAQNSVVRLKSDIGQGYLVLDKTNYQEVDHWKISTIKRIYNQDGTSNDQLIEEIALPSGKNYIKIPKERRINNNGVRYFAKIEGFTNANAEVIAEVTQISIGNGPPLELTCPGCEPYANGCYWKCNGLTYAWKIQEYYPVNGGNSYFAVESAYDIGVV
ncbi:MAG: hypothetical protein HY738_05640 [Bacteroidia bacterium]|nr:hypothetical protein [Bacteroidia bacterium]